MKRRQSNRDAVGLLTVPREAGRACAASRGHWCVHVPVLRERGLWGSAEVNYGEGAVYRYVYI